MQALRGLSHELLSGRPEQRTASVLWVARLARAEVDATTARTHAGEWRTEGLAGLLQRRPRRPDRGVGRDRAAALLALVDGLAVDPGEPDRMPATGPNGCWSRRWIGC